MSKQKIKWLLFSSVGLALVGAGLSLAIDAGFKKYDAQPWFFQGTLALIVFNTGLSLFGRAVAEYVWMKQK
jgi:hypothetical protein